jgi:hypothetical protein
MKRMKSLHFPVKGFGGLSLTFSEAFSVVVAMVSGMVSFAIGVVYWSVSVLFLVSRNQVSLSQGLEVSVYRGVKVLECTVRILAYIYKTCKKVSCKRPGK